MKKTILFKALALIVAMTASLSLVACGDDDDDDGPSSDDSLKSLSVNYEAIMTEDLFNFYDVTVEYGFAGKEDYSAKITQPNWSAQINYDVKSVKRPADVYCNIVATPKADRPDIDPDKTYSIKSQNSAVVTGVYSNNKTSILSISEKTHPSIVVKGDKLPTLLDRGEYKVLTFSYTLK